MSFSPFFIPAVSPADVPRDNNYNNLIAIVLSLKDTVVSAPNIALSLFSTI